MKFRTEIKIKKQELQIDYASKILLIGSCFSDNIGVKLAYYKFPVLSNPFGVIFNPVSIKKLIIRSLNEDFFTKSDFIFYNDTWQCLDLHSSLSSVDLEKAIEKANNALTHTRAYLLTASHIVLTFGTSWVYRFEKTEKIVANCHKIIQTEFKKELLSSKIIENSILEIIKEVKKVNPAVTFIFTISPVRHLKNGFFENNVSKAHLFQAVYSVVSVEKKFHSFYFPAYELLLDDLRDYRFYTEDMLHPNNLGINYIWNNFKETWLDKKSFPIIKKVESIQKRLEHKAFNPNSVNFQKFKIQLQKDILSLKENFGIRI